MEFVATPQNSAESEIEFLCSFDYSTDAMFLPTSQVEDLVGELLERPHHPDLVNRYISISTPASSRIAVMPSGLKALADGELESLYDAGGTVGRLYVVDVENDIEDVGRCILQLEDEPRAGLRWCSSKRDWESSGDDEQALARLRRLVERLVEPTTATGRFDLDVRLVRLSSQ